MDRKVGQLTVTAFVTLHSCCMAYCTLVKPSRRVALTRALHMAKGAPERCRHAVQRGVCEGN